MHVNKHGIQISCSLNRNITNNTCKNENKKYYYSNLKIQKKVT